MTEISSATTVWSALADAVASHGSDRCYVYQGKEISFAEVDAASDRVATALLNMGVKKGDRIGVNALNQPEWLYTYFAAAKIGAVIVGLNVRYRDSELDYILNHSEARAVVSLASLGDMDYVSFFDGFRKRVPSVRDYIFIGGEGFAGSHTFDSLMDTETDRQALAAARDDVAPDDLMIIIYTSGTTGRPKGAAISHKSQLASARAEAFHVRAHPDDVMPLALPFNHVGGITCGILTMLLARGTCVLIPMFIPQDVIRIMKENPPTVVAGVPTMHTLLLMQEDLKEVDTSSVRLVITGGSNAEPALLDKLYKAFPNGTVMNLYGLSETSGAVVLSPWESDFDTTVRSIGKTIGDFEVKVVDAEGHDLPGGEVGELCFRGDAVVSGYFRMPEETAEAFDRDGWLHTGDMGWLDEDGYITLMGRKKEMYIQGGFNVYPVEVENLLSKHPKVAMAAGIGVPDTVLGEVGRYYVVPVPGQEPTAAELQDYCREHLADYKVPKQIVFRSELPLTPVGKIMKAKLREDYSTGE
ncbi:MAG: class I adenylate-forming enzyme family protein [Desulfatibacillaceae bacterium]